MQKSMWFKETFIGKRLRFIKKIMVVSPVYVKKWALISSLHFNPKSSHGFSHMKRLPLPSQRLFKTSNPLDDFNITEDPLSEEISEKETFNIVMRGCSFDQKRLNQLKEKTFLVNWPDRVEQSNVVYATADQNDLMAMLNKGMTPLFFVHTVYYEKGEIRNNRLKPGIEEHIRSGTIKRIFLNHKGNAPNSPISSGLSVMVALTKYTQQMDIYGFDQYQTKDLGDMSHVVALFSLSKFSYGGPLLALFPSSLPPVNDIPERAIYCWHYAHRFNEISWIRNHGYLANVSKHKQLVKNLNQIFYN
jgi:hypothetical protein